jgi:signal transduction histidine kinase
MIHPQRVDLNDLVARRESALRSVLGDNIELVLALAPETGAVYADPSQVEQILLNLVLNARDAMPDGGRITIETARLAGGPRERDVAGEAPGAGRHVMLAVHDTGHGIDPAILPRIWEPFFSTKPAGQGTGLGLAVVHGAVKQSGGFVRAESEPNRQTVVSVHWPEIQADPQR